MFRAFFIFRYNNNFRDNGYPDDVSTYGLVSGLWTSMTALGFFVGPTIGGFLDHAVGFRWGTLFIFAEQIILVRDNVNAFARAHIDANYSYKLHEISWILWKIKIIIKSWEFFLFRSGVYSYSSVLLPVKPPKMIQKSPLRKIKITKTIS